MKIEIIYKGKSYKAKNIVPPEKQEKMQNLIKSFVEKNREHTSGYLSFEVEEGGTAWFGLDTLSKSIIIVHTNE